MRKHRRIVIISILLVISIAFNIFQFISSGYTSYLQQVDEIYTMESGILLNNLELAQGEDIEITYDFENAEYAKLIEQYHIDETAGEGTEFERAKRLMHEYGPRLIHKSTFTEPIEMNALDLLDYSLDNKKHGVNCRCKAQILNEMCLALGIYSRKVWINPYSSYDTDCHVINEVYDTSYQKWIMLDITRDEYWVDESGTPLSVLEIREYGANQVFCTPVKGYESLKDLHKLKEKHMDDFLSIMKNMVYTQYFSNYSVGEGEVAYSLLPDTFDSSDYVISLESVTASPLK